MLLEPNAQTCTDDSNNGIIVGGFEIDGNLCSNTTDDWTSISSVVSAFDGVKDSTQFTNGTKENNWPWAANSTRGDGTAGSDNDIVNVYAAQRTIGNSVYAFLGFQRDTANGTTQFVVELNAKPNLSSSSPTPDRSTNDLRLLISQQGNQPWSLNQADVWTSTGTNTGFWTSLPNTAGQVGRSNAVLVKNFDGSGTLDAKTFVEIPINLTTLFGTANCSGNYGTLNVRSSAADNDTSSLKDWVKPIELSVPSTCSSVQVNKNWNIDGVSYKQGDPLPDGFSANLKLTGQDSPNFGHEYTKHSDDTFYKKGDVVNVSESNVIVPAGCTNASSGIGDFTLDVGRNIFTITNKVTCTELTLVKNVVGDAPAGLWTLTADGPTPLSGVSRSDDVTNAGIEPGDYVLGETSDTDGYQLTSISCGENHPVSLDKKTVTIEAGEKVTCTFTNTAEVELTVTKTWVVNGVEYPNGEQPVGKARLTLDREPARFGDTTTGYPIGDEVEIAETVDEVTETVDGLPQLCILDSTTIDGVEGQTATHVMKREPDQNIVEVVNTVTCVQQLTLIKDVDNEEFAGTSTPNDWTLTATDVASNEVVASGKTEDDTVTEAKVPVGNYALSENGPAGYAAGAWTCEGTGSYADGRLKLELGQEVTCTIVNTANPGAVTWIKTDPSGNLLSGSIWTLTRVTEPNEFQPLTVEDCVESDAAACTGPDKDPEAGQFALEKMPWGSYELDETKAPAGYYAIDDPVTFEITGANLNIGIERAATENELREGPAIPLTGGLGRDFFAILGGGTVLVAALGAAAIKLRQRRKGVA